jgi:PAS domain S-box-containing protein
MTEFRVDDLDPRTSEELLASFFANAAVGLSITDLQGRFVKVNPSYCALTGYTEAELKALDFKSITHPDDLPRTLARCQSLIAGEISSFLIEKRYVRRDSIIVWVLNSVSLIRDKQGQPRYLVLLSQDITEQLQLEESLRGAEVRTESILANITDVYLLLDHQWRYVYANAAAVRAIGRAREQILRQTLWELFPDIVGTDLEREYRRAMKERVTVNFEFHYPARDNWWENRFYPVAAGLAVFASDITERKRNEEKLREYEKVVEGLEDMIVVIDEDYRYLIANRAFLKYRDLKKEQVVGHLIAEIVGHEFFETVIRKNLERCFSGEIVKYETTITYPRLGERNLSISYFPIEGPRGVDRVACILRDITKSRRAESALREAERKYRDIFENAGEGIFQSTPEGQYIAANPALAQMHGFDSPEDLIRARNDISTQIYADPGKRVEFQRLLGQHGTVRGFEHQIFRKDGSRIWISVNARAVRDEQGKIVYYEGTTQDISERKRAKDALLKLAAIVESSEDAIISKTLDGTITSWNKAAERTYGYLADEVIGRPISILIPSDRGQELPLILEKIGREQPLDHYETEHVRKDGQIISVSLTVSPIKNADGILTGASTIAHDITARKHAEQVEQELHQRIRDILENIGDGFVAINRDWRYTYVNRRAAEILRRRPEDLIGKNVWTEFPESVGTIQYNACQRVMHGLRSLEVEDHYFSPFESWYHSFIYQTPEGLAVCLRDVTEQKHAEKALHEGEERYRDLVENSSELICTHDLNGLVLSANPAAAAAVGYDLDEFLGKKSIQDILAPEVRDQFDEYMARLSRDRATSGIMYVQTKSGEYRIWEYHNSLRTEGVLTPIVRGMARDITEERRAQKALRESEERFSKAFYSSPAPLIITRLVDGCFLNANDSFLSAFEYERDEVIGKTVRELNIYVDHRDRKKLIAGLREQGALHGYESRARTRSGRILDLLVFVEPIKLKGEQCILSTAYDITERKSIEEALRESEERYRELFENAKDALYVHDLTGRYTSFNRAAEELSGFSRDEIIGKHFSNFVAPTHLKNARENLCRKLDDEVETTYEIDLITKDRRRVPVEVSSRLIYENGEPIGVQGVARDITERKRADEARARIALIVESSDDAIIGKTIDGTILSWNSGAEKIYGYSAREVIGSHVSILIPTDENHELARHLERVRRGESISHHETLGKRKDGKLINVSLTISPIRDARNQVVGVSTIARDVTRNKLAEEALQTFSRRLIEAQEAERKHIARELHDEIGQVLTAVRLNLQSLQSSMPPALPPSRIDESLGIVDEALDRVRELSLNLRPPVLDNLGLNSALRWYMDRYARRSGIAADLQSDLEDDRRLRIELETACFRIVQEALTNVARHAQATRVRVRLTRSNGSLELEIKDDGVGFNVDALLKDSPPAWALGLRGMEERAIAIDGHLKIDSAPTRGTKVRACFPLKARS